LATDKKITQRTEKVTSGGDGLDEKSPTVAKKSKPGGKNAKVVEVPDQPAGDKRKTSVKKTGSDKDAVSAEADKPAEVVVAKKKTASKKAKADTNTETEKPAKKKAAPKAEVVQKVEEPVEVVVTEKKGVKKDSKKAPAKEESAVKASKGGKSAKKVTPDKMEAADKETVTTVDVTFQIRFHTKFGQTIFVTGNHPLLGNNDITKALLLQYLNHEFWTVTFTLDKNTIPAEGIVYNYFIRYEDGAESFDWGSDKVLHAQNLTTPEVFILDSWNFAGYFENAFYTEPFKQVLLKQNATSIAAKPAENATHILKVKAPLLLKGQTIAVSGSVAELGNWQADKLVLLSKQEGSDFYTVALNLSKAAFPVTYKYIVYNVDEQKIIKFEDGSNRNLYNAAAPGRQTIVNDGFAVLSNNSWKGAGVAVPVFSLRSTKSAGVGEFADIKLLVDWAKKTGLRLVQILPVNDTTATHSWTDSYPYAAISAFALHPMFLRLDDLADEQNKQLLNGLQEEIKHLNSLPSVDYEAVNKLKWSFIKAVYPSQKDTLFASEGYKQFYQQNSHWLVPYAAFCYFRDKYNTADFNSWPQHKTYDAAEIALLLGKTSAVYNEVAVHFFIQYHLHVQLKAATQYAHDNGVIVKGDIPIGVYRYGADAWQNPELYHMDMQAGAPPDDFAVTGQNWGFPTYNWEKMQQDGFAWWKQRLEQMSYYFDAFRIDHILGFFRIWAIPVNQVEGIMGRFQPAISIHKNEFYEKGIWFDYNRYCKPFVTDKLLNDVFGNQQNHVRHHFLNYDGFGSYQLKPEYATQRQLENYFSWQEDNEHNRWLKQALYNIVSNVILFEEERSGGNRFHFRFGMEGTSSFQNLDGHTQYQLKELYVNYYFRRQDDFWKNQAMKTLPALKRVTNMLVCGEDLGLVPACVPDVMKQLGLLSLEIQRMPKDAKKEFFHPADAPYLSVVTPSTHDMSTIRGWWEEDRHKTQRFYNNEIGQWGMAPHFCEAWVNKTIVVQHLHSPAMWSIFQLQDLLGIDKEVRRDNPHEERINVPAIPKYYWRYRMHLTLEQLLGAESFNTDLRGNIKASGRV
jgi:4-alpha-glucanotransferase